MILQKLRTNNQKGFTLIELLVVIGIIGILAAIAIPAFMQYKKRGYYAAQGTDAKNAYTAAQAYYNIYPAKNLLTLDDLQDYGFKSSQNVTLKIINGTANSLVVTFSHPESDRTYTLNADGSVHHD